MNTNENLNTGLPVLPEGYFWRVTDEYHIEIRKTIPAEAWGPWYDKPERSTDPYEDYQNKCGWNLYNYGQEYQPSWADTISSAYLGDDEPRSERESRDDTRTREVQVIDEVEVPAPSFFNRNRTVKKKTQQTVTESYIVNQRRHRKGQGSSQVFAKRFGEWKTEEYDHKTSLSEPYANYGVYSSWTSHRTREVIVKKRRDVLVSGEPTDHTNLYQRCLETLAGWEASKKRAELLGDYPPKTFGGTR